jgi:hypothetical protein
MADTNINDIVNEDDSTNDDDDSYENTHVIAPGEHPYAYMMHVDNDGNLIYPEVCIFPFPWDNVLNIAANMDKLTYQMFRLTCRTTNEYILPNNAKYDPVMLFEAAINGYTGVFEILVAYIPTNFAEFEDLALWKLFRKYPELEMGLSDYIPDYFVVRSSLETIRDRAIHGKLSSAALKIAAKLNRLDVVKVLLDEITADFSGCIESALSMRNIKLLQIFKEHPKTELTFASVMRRQSRFEVSECIRNNDIPFINWLIDNQTYVSERDIYECLSYSVEMIDAIYKRKPSKFEFNTLASIAIDTNRINMLDWIYSVTGRITSHIYDYAIRLRRPEVCRWAISKGIVPRKDCCGVGTTDPVDIEIREIMAAGGYVFDDDGTGIIW